MFEIKSYWLYYNDCKKKKTRIKVDLEINNIIYIISKRVVNIRSITAKTQ